jgi:outer membrane cobalamin receptor
MEHLVVAAPEHKLYAGVNYLSPKWKISTGVQYIQDLYSAIVPTPVAENYLLWNLRLAYKPVKFLEIYAKGENLLDQSYEINAGYPMPGITVFGGVVLRF